MTEYVFDPPTRPTPFNSVEIVAAMPRRMAHALFALLTAEAEVGASKIGDVMLYDEEAMSTRSTAAALTAAMRQGYCVCGRGVWASLPKVGDLKGALEDRYLRETEEL